jgi:adenosylmethionine-8-amino-7-oxononanoate aminotransferase
MSTEVQHPSSSVAVSDLQALAKRHLWMHFTRMGAYEDHEVPVIERGEGCYVYDTHGKRYLDGLSALYCVNAGHGRAELGEAAAEQAKRLGFYTNWSYAHPPSIELAARIAKLAPGDLNRVFFVSGGSEAVESAWKLAKAYHTACGEPRKHKIVSRYLAYHGTSMGALTATGLPPLREPFEPLTPGGRHVPNTNSYRWAEDRDPLWAADAIEEAIEFEGPHTVAAVILEPVQNGGGCFVPQDGYFQRVREICDRHKVLLISDEVICAWGRLGHWFGCERYDYSPDIVTTAKGMTSAYAPMGAVIVSDRVAEPFLHARAIFNHGFTFGGHPMACAVAMARRRLLPRDRAGEGQGHQAHLRCARVGGAAARLPLRRAVRAWADLPHRRPGRPDRAALSALDRRPRAVRGDRGHPAAGAHRGLGAAREEEGAGRC